MVNQASRPYGGAIRSFSTCSKALNWLRKHSCYTAFSDFCLMDRIIRGWANYYPNVCSKATFNLMNHLVYRKLRAWAYHRHPHKNRHWIIRKYWLIGTGEGWIFATRNDQGGTRLFQHIQTPIKRHIKVQGNRSPYDGDWLYWSRRMGKYPTATSTVARLLKYQSGKCSHCGLYFWPDARMEIHHLDRNRDNHKRDNLTLLHRHCHDQIHAMYV